MQNQRVLGDGEEHAAPDTQRYEGETIDQMSSLQDKFVKYSGEVDRTRELFYSAHGLYGSLREAAQVAVFRTEWSNRTRYSLEPLHFEILNFPRGKLLKNEPKTKCNVVASGLDQHEKLVYLREYNEFEGQCYEDFIQYKPDRIISFLFSYSTKKEPINACQYLISNGNVECFHRFAANGHSTTVYNWDDDRVTLYYFIGQDRLGTRAEHTGTVHYFDDGVVERIVLDWVTGEQETVYKSRRKRKS